MDIGTWLISLGVVAIAGFTRGFSGFGSGLILAPALSLLFTPQLVVATVVLLEMTAGAGLVPEALGKTKWKQVLPLVLSAMALVPVGARFLALLEPTLLRRIIGGLILGFVLLLLTGKSRYTHPRLALTSGVGALSGFLTGLAGIGGPPIVLYQMSSSNLAAANRANFIVFFALTQIIALGSYWASGLISVTVGGLFIRLLPAFVVGQVLGQRCFRRVNEKLFRRFVVGLLLIVAGLALVA
ncbi:sulfite exporter TauE/SafE family protein [Nodosilinea sp. LEGE 06152]|uniref:sulfite exporter TauE/SafE family protein n=1 Tax=Nodosilinea sp. LEGE 06152 TaxID=2777966 RepID=UPI001881950C|nr:sulfite exporter TauE/SafE family protein [Nodosilinea sp. LEGE 06152]MBE9159893.1 sulfite exporter TauE/SafE family protein [Nodosilinea sp. LEGE 06152]